MRVKPEWMRATRNIRRCRQERIQDTSVSPTRLSNLPNIPYPRKLDSGSSSGGFQRLESSRFWSRIARCEPGPHVFDLWPGRLDHDYTSQPSQSLPGRRKALLLVLIQTR